MQPPDSVKIKSATYLKGYVYRFEFSDGEISEVDFHEYILHGGKLLKPLLDPAEFKKINIYNDHLIHWNKDWGDHELYLSKDYDMSFDIEAIYKKTVIKPLEYLKSRFLTMTIDAATYMQDYCILVAFSDRTGKLLDFSPYIHRAKHPAIKRLLSLEKFKEFKIDEDKKDIHWGDYDVVFNIEQLYNNRIKDE